MDGTLFLINVTLELSSLINELMFIVKMNFFLLKI
jgi:hypothetical protein